LFIVAIGDSYGSGQGAPDQIAQFDWLQNVTRQAQWEDVRCNRSRKAAFAQAVERLKRAAPGRAIDFVSFACSGAEVETGLLAPYDGPEPPAGNHQALEPQINQVVAASCGKVIRTNPQSGKPGSLSGRGAPYWTCAVTPRPIDALLVSIGGNDVGFADIVEQCMLNVCNVPIWRPFIGDSGTRAKFQNDLSVLERRYARLRDVIKQYLPHVRTVYFGGYPDPTYGADGNHCDHEPVNPQLPFGPRLADQFSLIGRDQSTFASTVIIPQLNDRVRGAAALEPHWHYIAPADFMKHGYCADTGSGFTPGSPTNRWVNTVTDSFRTRGWPIISSAMHPNDAGQAAMAERYFDVLKDLLNYPSLNVSLRADSPPGPIRVGTPTRLTILVSEVSDLGRTGRPLSGGIARFDGDPTAFPVNSPISYTFHGTDHFVDVSGIIGYGPQRQRFSAGLRDFNISVSPSPVPLNTPIRLTVTAVDRLTGAPVPSARVHITDAGGGQIPDFASGSTVSVTLHSIRTIVRGTFRRTARPQHARRGEADPVDEPPDQVGFVDLPSGSVTLPPDYREGRIPGLADDGS